MTCGRKLSRVCSLVNTSLGPYKDFDSISLTKLIEKDVLIVLSTLFKQIQLLEAQPDSDDDVNVNADDDDVDDDDVGLEGSGCTVTDRFNHHCLTKVIANLLVFLSAESHFVQHSAGNVLVAVSKFATFAGDSWKCYIRSLCDCLEVAMSTTLSHPLIAGAEGMKTFYALVLIKPKLVAAVANWSTVSCIIRVLRDILKYLKQDYNDDRLLTVIYLDCVSSCLSNIPLDLLKDINSCGNGDFQQSLFLGNLVQFLCSLVEQSSLTEARNEPPIVAQISNLVPGILRWCLGKLEGHNNAFISSYFTHKLLMLMIRLICSRISQNYSMIVTWMELLHKYFQHLLLQSLTQLEYGGEDCLEGSPFASSLCDGELSSMDTRHLQRQAIFLFLRCSMCLIGFKEDTLMECACEALINSRSPYDLSLNPECCSKKKGFLEIYHWLEGHLPSNMFRDSETYKEKCTRFAQSFLKLYMNEDDILFQVLLQLFSINNSKQSLYEERGTWKDVKKDILHHIANIFHPICLFHLFLAELHYDHQVLLDYLISKDTGISCAEYFLRCLRVVCNSWHLFEEFSWGEMDLSGSSCKKRKLNADAPNSRERLLFTPVKGDVVVSLSNEEHSALCHTTTEKSSKEAKKCLLSLKSSIEKLSQKKLFPYNPEVLLRRLKRFEELCLKMMSSFQCSISKNISRTC